jgi:hypothetical protein
MTKTITQWPSVKILLKNSYSDFNFDLTKEVPATFFKALDRVENALSDERARMPSLADMKKLDKLVNNLF